MSVSAGVLRTLHQLHCQLAEQEDRLQRGPQQIKAAQANVARLEQALAEIREKTTAARIAADQKQLQLKTGETKILDLRTKLNTCSTNREYQALLEQIAADEMANSVLEDEILEALEKIEQLQVNVGETEQGVDKSKAELAKVQQQVSSTTDSIKADIERLKQELATAEKQLPEDFRPEYDRTMKVRGADGMAPVENDCCTGCYQQITPNILSKLMMSHVVCCTTCARLLYLPEEGK
ncbi:MAG: phospholipase [Planctomycetota bacterium]|nr:phospholipase [Planctomycetota bacterium]